jgi:hypothetical protein
MLAAANASNVDYGLVAVRDRPDDIPRRCDPRWLHLSVYAVERMAVARHELPANPCLRARRLCRFWLDLSGHVMRERLDGLVLDVLADLDDYDYQAAGYWFDGLWHRNGVSMARLLWQMQMPDHLVSAAFDLHRTVSRRSTAAEDESRDGSIGGRFIGLIMLCGVTYAG